MRLGSRFGCRLGDAPGGDGVRLLASTIAREPTRAAVDSHRRHDRVVRFIQATGAQREDQTQRQLRRILGSCPVSDWVFTRDIRIEANAVPHSHPVLTLNTRHLDDDHQLLATFISTNNFTGVSPSSTHTLSRSAIRTCPSVHPPRDHIPCDRSERWRLTARELCASMTRRNGPGRASRRTPPRRRRNGCQHQRDGRKDQQ